MTVGTIQSGQKYIQMKVEGLNVEGEKSILLDKVKIILQKSAIEEVKRWTGHPDDIINMSERELPRVKFVRSHAIAARHIYWTLDTSLGIGFPGHCRYIR